jgi:hypothetical protein
MNFRQCKFARADSCEDVMALTRLGGSGAAFSGVYPMLAMLATDLRTGWPRLPAGFENAILRPAAVLPVSVPNWSFLGPEPCCT